MADISFKQINGIQEMMCRYCFIIFSIRLLLLFTSIRTVFYRFTACQSYFRTINLRPSRKSFLKNSHKKGIPRVIYCLRALVID